MEFWLGSSHPAKDFENADSMWIRIIFALNFLTAIGSAIGIVLLWRASSPYAFPAAVFVVVVPLVYYVTHASLRYRHPIDPIVLILTAIAVIGGRRNEVENALPARDELNQSTTHFVQRARLHFARQNHCSSTTSIRLNFRMRRRLGATPEAEPE
jgi:hypothetical protein